MDMRSIAVRSVSFFRVMTLGGNCRCNGGGGGGK